MWRILFFVEKKKEGRSWCPGRETEDREGTEGRSVCVPRQPRGPFALLPGQRQDAIRKPKF